MKKMYQNAVLVDGKHVMRSAHRHDLAEYEGLSLDGGTDYRRQGGDPGQWERRVTDLVLYEGDSVADAVEKLTMRREIGSDQWMMVSEADTEKLLIFYQTINAEPVLRPVLLVVLHAVLSKRTDDLEPCVVQYEKTDTIADVLQRGADPETVLRIKKEREQQVMMYLSTLAAEKDDVGPETPWEEVEE